jgi:uncharacterized membrane protein YqiK
MEFLTSTLPIIIGVSIVAGLIGAFFLSGIRHIPNNRVGIIEKMWSNRGSLGEGEIIALTGEAGYQDKILRGGIHFRLWRWQYSIHKVELVKIRQNKLGYVFARDGVPLNPSQALGTTVSEGNNFQNARGFLDAEGQRGRQREILREGVYAINLALFDVITEEKIYSLEPAKNLVTWQEHLGELHGFDPVIIGITETDDIDDIGIVTTHEGPALGQGQIIAPAVGEEEDDEHFHENYQDIEKFLLAGGRRGLQYTPLIDGTYYLNRWFVTIEKIAKHVVPIGHVGVVVSYYGAEGHDVSGEEFRHGERVADNERGVRAKTLGPGKYAFNTYAGEIILVPTTNFVLHWVTGKTEDHNYDANLRSIELVTKDAYEPVLPLSVVVHIDYTDAPSVIQRFGDVKKLITQTIDPLLSAYFRDIAHSNSMLELIHKRAELQRAAKAELKTRFGEFDIQCVDVLIGKPDPTADDDGAIERLLEQLRQRQLSKEQIETYQKQQEAATAEIQLNAAKAKAHQQEEITRSKLSIEITANKAEAELKKAEMEAKQVVVTATADKEASVLKAQGASESEKLKGEGESSRVKQVGDAEADVMQQKVESFGDPQLYALQVVSENLSHSEQPLVPEHVFNAGGNGNGGSNMLEVLIGLVTAEKVGFPTIVPKVAAGGQPEALEEVASDPSQAEDDEDDESDVVAVGSDESDNEEE